MRPVALREQKLLQPLKPSQIHSAVPEALISP